MQPRVPGALACLLGGAFLCAAFAVGAGWSDSYLTQYGTFLLSRGELAFKLHLLLFVLPAMVLVALAAAQLYPSQLWRAFDALEHRRADWIGPLLLAGAVLLAVRGLRLLVLRDTVITDDENVYHFQAQLLASGRLYADSLPEPVRPFFNNQFIINNGRWFGVYFLGHPALLAIASRLGLAEWLGAILAALTLLLCVAISRRLFSERVAIMARFLLALSPFFLFVSATHLSQPSSTLFLTLFVYAAVRIENSPHVMGWWALAAISLVCGTFVRPQTAVFLSLPFVVRLAYLFGYRSPRHGWAGPVAALVILAVGAAGFLTINQALTGSPWKTGYQAYMAQGIPWLYPFGPLYTIREISQSLVQLNFWLLGWPLCLMFVPFFERNGLTWSLAAVPIVALTWYGLVATPTVAAVGPVYYAETIVPLVILTASGMEGTVILARQRFGDIVPTRALIALPIAGALASVLSYLPYERASLRLQADVARAPYDLVEERGLTHALVFVDSLPGLYRFPGSWAYFHRNPSPELSDKVLFVRDLGPRNEDLIRHLSDRAPFWMGMKNGQLVLLPLKP